MTLVAASACGSDASGPDCADAIENTVIELLRSGRLKGVGTGQHPTNEVGEMVVSGLRSTATV